MVGFHEKTNGSFMSTKKKLVRGSGRAAGCLHGHGAKTASHRAGRSGDCGSGGDAGRLHWRGTQTMLVEYTPLAMY